MKGIHFHLSEENETQNILPSSCVFKASATSIEIKCNFVNCKMEMTMKHREIMRNE